MPKPRILVAGDIVKDNHIYVGERSYPSLDEMGTYRRQIDGGARLLCSLVEKVYKEAAESVEPYMSSGPNDRAYAVWNVVKQAKLSDKEDKNETWRVSQLLGYSPKPEWRNNGLPKGECPDCDIAVLDDAGLGFRFAKRTWPKFMLDDGEPHHPDWIILKMSHPVLEGDLWFELRKRYVMDRAEGHKIVIVVGAEDLRRSGVTISSGHSWEHSVQDLLDGFKDNQIFAGVRECGHFLVTFQSEGALWIDNTGDAPRAKLVFDPKRLEGDYEDEFEGQMVGAGSCFTAGLVGAFLESPDSAAMELGIKRGLHAARVLWERGHEPVSRNRAPGYPFSAVRKALSSKPDTYTCSEVPHAAFREGTHDWSFLEDGGHHGTPMYGQARRLALSGFKDLKGIPYGEYGALLTADRGELESYNSLRRLILSYRDDTGAKKPLSIGVFGPPGAGKSFGVEEIAKGTLGQDVPLLVFNLSQFDINTPDMLHGALHQVRDEAIKGSTPVVFWDEFDCRGLQWLQYLLSPMQDGSFVDDQITRVLGKCLFVFAGGVMSSRQEFVTAAEWEKKGIEEFEQLKGPDFASRLHGYLDVLGPNRREPRTKDEYGRDLLARPDLSFPVRRAILIRGLLRVGKSDELDIDPGLLNALLKVRSYKHGTRSLQNLLKMLSKNPEGRYMPSSLPPAEQLRLFVDEKEFMEHVVEYESFQTCCHELAVSVHDHYWDDKIKRGWGKEEDREPFEQLSESLKADNVAAALRIPEILALVGLRLVRKESSFEGDPREIKTILENNIELLARAEHILWRRYRTLSGWKVHKKSKTDYVWKRHKDLIDFDDLTPDKQEYDRDSVRAYPAKADKAGFKIVKES